MNQLIAALKRCIDDDGHLHLDRDQTLYLLFLFYELQDHESQLKDGISIKFAVEDLLGVLPDEEMESAV